MKVTTRQKPVVFTAKNFKQAAVYTKDAMFNGTPAQLSAGVAYFGTLSFFPLLAVLVAVGGMTLDDSQVVAIVNGIANYMPKDITSLISTQLQNAAANQQANAIVAVLAVGLAVFGVSGAMASIIKAINTIYNLKDERSFIKQQLLSIGLTILFIVGIALVLPLVFIGAKFLQDIGLPPAVVSLFGVLRWVFLVIIALVGLAVIYHFAPALKRKWKWLSWGSIIATIMWIAITAGFFIYLQYFANFSNSYSLFAGIIALMMWINFSALAVLVGAYVNKSFEQSLSKK